MNYFYESNGLAHTISSSSTKQSISLGYDDLNRLEAFGSRSRQDYRYDGIGNMTYNSAHGEYTYCDTDTSCVRPHAVKSAGSAPYGYDANGNMTSRNGHRIIWNDDNKPTWFQGSESTWVGSLFDSFGDRVFRSSTNMTPSDNQLPDESDSGSSTRYYGRYLELSEAVGLKKYYYAGSKLVAEGSGEHKAYYHTDHIQRFCT